MHKNEVSLERFTIIKDDFVPILGLETCVNLGLIKRIDSINNNQSKISLIDEKSKFIRCHSPVFEGIGKSC